MTNEQPATPPLSPKLNNTNEKLHVTPVKSYAAPLPLDGAVVPSSASLYDAIVRAGPRGGATVAELAIETGAAVSAVGASVEEMQLDGMVYVKDGRLLAL